MVENYNFFNLEVYTNKRLATNNKNVNRKISSLFPRDESRQTFRFGIVIMKFYSITREWTKNQDQARK